MRIQQGPSRVKRIGHGVMGTPKVMETGAVVPRHPRLHLLGRRLRRQQGQHHRLVQPARPRRRRSSTITCSSASTNERRRPEPPVVRGAGHGRRVHGPRAPARSSASTSTCGASAGISSAARSTTTGSDPWGRVHEHWSDTDRLNSEERLEPDLGGRRARSQWGERPPERFLNRVIAWRASMSGESSRSSALTSPCSRRPRRWLPRQPACRSNRQHARADRPARWRHRRSTRSPARSRSKQINKRNGFLRPADRMGTARRSVETGWPDALRAPDHRRQGRSDPRPLRDRRDPLWRWPWPSATRRC